MSRELQAIAAYLISKDIDIFEPDIVTPIKKLVDNEPIILADAERFMRERNKTLSDLGGARDLVYSLETDNQHLQEEVRIYRKALNAIAAGLAKPAQSAKRALNRGEIHGKR